MTGGRPCARIVLAQHIGRFNHEVARNSRSLPKESGLLFRCQSGREELREIPRLGINFVSADFQHFLDARFEQRVGEDLIKAGDYDAERDAYICPAGQVLATRYESKLRDLKKFDYSNRAACLVCAIRSRCTKDFRKVSRLENEAVLDRMAARLKARPEILNTRRKTSSILSAVSNNG